MDASKLRLLTPLATGMSQSKSTTRGKLVAQIVQIVLEKYPVTWSTRDLALATGCHERTVRRAVSDLVETGVLETYYRAYRLNTKLATQILGAKWYLRKETEKTICLQTQTN